MKKLTSQEYLEYQKEFPTDSGDFKTFLFIDERLMINFLRSLPQKGLLNFRVSFNYTRLMMNCEIIYLILMILSLAKKVFLDTLDWLEEDISKTFTINNIRLKSLDFYSEMDYANIYVHVFLFDHIKKVVKDYLYNEINIIYYMNMSSEEKILLKS